MGTNAIPAAKTAARLTAILVCITSSLCFVNSRFRDIGRVASSLRISFIEARHLNDILIGLEGATEGLRSVDHTAHPGGDLLLALLIESSTYARAVA